MNTNNRNVRLQQHVVLLNVMEHAEDLIKKVKKKKETDHNEICLTTCHTHHPY